MAPGGRTVAIRPVAPNARTHRKKAEEKRSRLHHHNASWGSVPRQISVSGQPRIKKSAFLELETVAVPLLVRPEPPPDGIVIVRAAKLRPPDSPLELRAFEMPAVLPEIVVAALADCHDAAFPAARDNNQISVRKAPPPGWLCTIRCFSKFPPIATPPRVPSM